MAELLAASMIQVDKRHLTAEKAVFFFDANRRLDHIEAENKIVLLEQPPGRKGTGDKATYLVNKRMIYISGSPAVVTDPQWSSLGELAPV